METIENTILKNLLINEDYARKVLPFIKTEYFDNTHEKVVFEETAKFISQYNKLATREVLHIECEKRNDINDITYKEVCEYIDNFDSEQSNHEWL